MALQGQEGLRIRQCIVCRLGSHRVDWAESRYPACDSHSSTEIKQAIAASQGVARQSSTDATSKQQSNQAKENAAPASTE